MAVWMDSPGWTLVTSAAAGPDRSIVVSPARAAATRPRDNERPMSPKNVEMLRRFIDRWNDGDAELALDVLDPEFELHSPFSSVAGEPYRGARGYREWIADITDQFEEWKMNID